MTLSDYRTEAAAEEAIVARSAKESARFGLDIARIQVRAEADHTPEGILLAAEAGDFDVVVVRYPAVHVDWFARLSASRCFQPLHADTLLYFQKALCLAAPIGPPLDVYRAHSAADAATLERLAGRCFQEYRSHYYANPLLRRRAIADGYAEWARAYCAADDSRESAFIAQRRSDQRIVGFATVVSDPEPEFSLVGVTPEASGQGLYGSILDAVESLLTEGGATLCSISTQVHNLAVIRTVTKRHYRPVLSLQTVHLVKRTLLKD